jgi:membrane protein DedA with SNARE-associated domain
MMDLVTSWVAGGGLLGVFALMFLENLFPPIPSEVIMPLAGFAAARGQMSLAGVLIAGILGTMVGNVVWFEAARAFGAERFKRLGERYGRWLGIRRDDLDQAEATLRKYGAVAVCIGRCMPGIRTLISVPAGLIEMPRPVFYGWTALGTTVWVGLLTLAGYLLEERYTAIEGYIDPLSKPLLGLAACWCCGGSGGPGDAEPRSAVFRPARPGRSMAEPYSLPPACGSPAGLPPARLPHPGAARADVHMEETRVAADAHEAIDAGEGPRGLGQVADRRAAQPEIGGPAFEVQAGPRRALERRVGGGGAIARVQHQGRSCRQPPWISERMSSSATGSGPAAFACRSRNRSCIRATTSQFGVPSAWRKAAATSSPDRLRIHRKRDRSPIITLRAGLGMSDRGSQRRHAEREQRTPAWPGGSRRLLAGWCSLLRRSRHVGLRPGRDAPRRHGGHGRLGPSERGGDPGQVRRVDPAFERRLGRSRIAGGRLRDAEIGRDPRRRAGPAAQRREDRDRLAGLPVQHEREGEVVRAGNVAGIDGQRRAVAELRIRVPSQEIERHPAAAQRGQVPRRLRQHLVEGCEGFRGRAHAQPQLPHRQEQPGLARRAFQLACQQLLGFLQLAVPGQRRGVLRLTSASLGAALEAAAYMDKATSGCPDASAAWATRTRAAASELRIPPWLTSPEAQPARASAASATGPSGGEAARPALGMSPASSTGGARAAGCDAEAGRGDCVSCCAVPPGLPVPARGSGRRRSVSSRVAALAPASPRSEVATAPWRRCAGSATIARRLCAFAPVDLQVPGRSKGSWAQPAASSSSKPGAPMRMMREAMGRFTPG